MSSVTIEVELPDDWAQFSLPPALDARLTTLLDEQDRAGVLEESQRREAEALCKLVDMLAVLRLRAERASRK
jgi:hypothetical protein